MNCKLIEKKLLFFIENELDVKEMESVREHLDKCSDCHSLYLRIHDCIDLIQNDRLTETNPFFVTRVTERLKSANNKGLIRNLKKEFVLQLAFYLVLGMLAIFSGLYLGSGNQVIDESKLTQGTDTTDYQLFANSYNFNFNKNANSIEIVSDEE